MIIKCLYRSFPRGCQCQAGQQGTPTSAQPGNKILMIIAPQLATSVTRAQRIDQINDRICSKCWHCSTVISTNLDLALLMAPVHNLSCLTRWRCVRILGRKFGEGNIFIAEKVKKETREYQEDTYCIFCLYTTFCIGCILYFVYLAYFVYLPYVIFLAPQVL